MSDNQKPKPVKKAAKKKDPPAAAGPLKPVVEFITGRIKMRSDILRKLGTQPLNDAPESVQKMREEESRIHRAILMDNEDILAIIKTMKL